MAAHHHPPTVGVPQGQLTQAMSAIKAQKSKKQLRIGKVESGKVTDERLMKQCANVTVGVRPDNLFTIVDHLLGEKFVLFEHGANGYYVNLVAGMSGKLAIGNQIFTVQELLNGRPSLRWQLDETSRGKIVCEQTSFLFQFVDAAAPMGRPMLPFAVHGSVSQWIDWRFTMIAAFSFLGHFAMAGAVNSDLFDIAHDEEAEAVALIQQARERAVPPLEEPKQLDSIKVLPKDTAKKIPAKEPSNAVIVAENTTTKSNSSRHNGRPSSRTVQVSQSNATAVLGELERLELKVLTSMQGIGPAQSQLFSRSHSAVDVNLDDLAKKAQGTAVESNRLRMGTSDGTPLLPGAPNTLPVDGLQIKSTPQPKPNLIAQTTQPVIPNFKDFIPPVPSPPMPDMDTEIAKHRWRFRVCYRNILAKDSTAKGTVRVTVRVGEGGRVISTSTSGDAPSELKSCVASAFHHMKFREPKGGHAVFTVPVILEPR